MESNKRNADKDREIIAMSNELPLVRAIGYSWLERATSAEAEAEKWRIEAFRQHPTPEAYESACTALEKHRVRADSAEQRVAELEETLRRMMKILEPEAKPYRPAAYAYHEAVKALKGSLESEDRGK